MAVSSAEREGSGIWAFLKMLMRRFGEDRCLSTASELSFITLFAMVPLMAAAFPLLAAVPIFRDAGRGLQEFVFHNFVPASGEMIGEHLRRFAERATKLPLVSLLVLLGTIFTAIATVEHHVNAIWRVDRQRPIGRRLLLYWAALILVPLLAGTGFLISSYLTSLPWLARFSSQAVFAHGWLKPLVWGSELGAFFLLYWLVPHRRVPGRPALVSAVVATLIFEAAKKVFTIYLHRVPTYEAIYGALAAIPLFMFWVYISWVVTLFGAELTCCLTLWKEQGSGDSAAAPEDSGREGDHGAEELEEGIDGDPDQAEGEQQQPHDGVEDEGEQREGPAEHQQQTPQ